MRHAHIEEFWGAISTQYPTALGLVVWGKISIHTYNPSIENIAGDVQFFVQTPVGDDMLDTKIVRENVMSVTTAPDVVVLKQARLAYAHMIVDKEVTE